MSKEWFSSPKEEALEIAYRTRKGILGGSNDPVAILRACLVIATDLAKKPTVEWIGKELSGYTSGEQIPSYRAHSCPVNNKLGRVVRFEQFELYQPVHYLFACYNKGTDLAISLEYDQKLVVNQIRLDSTFAAIVDKCFQFLNETITELQYGGVVEFLMEEIRRKTDEKLATYDPRITEEVQSLYLSLTSTNPADWSKVGHSCRRLLKLLADNVFQPCDEKYNTKDGRVLEVTDRYFINRLYAFLDKKSSPDDKKFLGAQIEYLESYIKQVVNYAQMAEHNPSIEKFHANMLAIHTYLVISSVLRHVPDKPSD